MEGILHHRFVDQDSQDLDALFLKVDPKLEDLAKIIDSVVDPSHLLNFDQRIEEAQWLHDFLLPDTLPAVVKALRDPGFVVDDDVLLNGLVLQLRVATALQKELFAVV